MVESHPSTLGQSQPIQKRTERLQASALALPTEKAYRQAEGVLPDVCAERQLPSCFGLTSCAAVGAGGMIEVTPIAPELEGAGDSIGVLRKVVRLGRRSSGKTTSEFQGEPSMVRWPLMAPLILAALTPLAAAAGDAGAGQKVFSFYCIRCHQIGVTAKNAVGPKLNGLFGRPAGSVEGFSYSSANKNSGIVWDEATFREYIKGPKAKIPDTKMDFPGLKADKEIDDIVVFLNQFAADGKKK